MRAGLEAPGKIRRQLLQTIKGRWIGRQEQGLSWRPSETRVAAHAEANFVAGRDAVANVPGVREDQIGGVHTLPVSMEIRAGCGIIEAGERAAKLCATAYGGKAPALHEEIRSWDPRR